MNVLFICVGNVMRSQIAEAYFNNRHPVVGSATSAGTMVSRFLGRRLRAYAHHTVRCMAEIGLDLSDCMAKQLTYEMVEKSDRVIIMAERQTWPAYLRRVEKCDGTEVWGVKDPRREGYDGHVRARDEVIKRVDALFKIL